MFLGSQNPGPDDCSRHCCCECPPGMTCGLAVLLAPAPVAHAGFSIVLLLFAGHGYVLFGGARRLAALSLDVRMACHQRLFAHAEQLRLGMQAAQPDRGSLSISACTIWHWRLDASACRWSISPSSPSLRRVSKTQKRKPGHRWTTAFPRA